jgi:hypothetical protein
MIGIISQEANRPLCLLTYTYHGCPLLFDLFAKLKRCDNGNE